ncbi:MAG: efflux RND transporter periplasmic adaptor subunit [Hyphomicrobiales bacterium]
MKATIAFAAMCLMALNASFMAPHAYAAEAAKKAEDKPDEAKKAKKKGGQRPTLVGVDAVREEPLEQTVPIIGRLVSMRSGEVSAEIAGAVHKLTVNVGDHIEKGDLIAELDSISATARIELLNAEIRQAEADVVALEADLTLSMQDLARQEKLKKSGAFTRAKFEDAIQNVAKAKANILRAKAIIAAREANRRLTEIVLEKTTIRAPYDGVVLRKMTETGDYVRAGDPVISMLSDKDLEIEADVPSNRLGGLNVGAKLDILLEDGSRHHATVRSVLPTENPLTRTRPVRFLPVFDGTMNGLADAQTVTVEVPVGARRQVVTVHKDAVIKRGGGSLVFVIAEEKAEQRRIELGEETGPRVVVIDGLKPGDQVVVRGNERLRSGAPVKVRKGS